MLSTKSVLGLVRNRAQADSVLEALLHTGFVRTDFSTLAIEGPSSQGALVHGLPRPVYLGAAAAIGAGVGAVLGLLVGVGVFPVPGIEPFLVAAPILSAIGAAFTGGAFGGVAGSLAGIGIAEVEAKQYEEKIRKGAILISVNVDDRDQRAHAKKVLEGYGATHISTVGEEYVRRQISSAAA